MAPKSGSIVQRLRFVLSSSSGMSIKRARKKLASVRKRDFLLAYLRSHPCVDCGETDIVVLEFDHVRGEKVNNIGNLLWKGLYELFVIEVLKCDVRCANCHKRKTAKEQGWWKLKCTPRRQPPTEPVSKPQ